MIGSHSLDRFFVCGVKGSQSDPSTLIPKQTYGTCTRQTCQYLLLIFMIAICKYIYTYLPTEAFVQIVHFYVQTI